MEVSRLIFRSFKSKGLSITEDASKALQAVLSRFYNKEQYINKALNFANLPIPFTGICIFEEKKAQRKL